MPGNLFYASPSAWFLQKWDPRLDVCSTWIKAGVVNWVCTCEICSEIHSISNLAFPCKFGKLGIIHLRSTALTWIGIAMLLNAIHVNIDCLSHRRQKRKNCKRRLPSPRLNYSQKDLHGVINQVLHRKKWIEFFRLFPKTSASAHALKHSPIPELVTKTRKITSTTSK